MLSLGCGIIISALTTKYRDLSVLVTFGIQLWMYGSAIVFPVSSLPEKWARLLMLNPVVPIVETFRYGFTVLFIGIVIFNRVEKTFMDTV